ncbi:MAG: flagellin, partial [Gammaproteobacteria bacterium]|nr:flagellin [Gammaproteobacteria bacterium]NIR94120.1 flagellin [Gammaproteobacteria bacterium]
SPETANMAIGMIDSALQQISKQRADLGAYQNRFEHASKGVAVAAENLQAAESRIRDVDMAT